MCIRECSYGKRKPRDPVCPHIPPGAGCASVSNAMSSTRCFFSIAQIMSVFRIGHTKNRKKAMKGTSGVSAKSRRTVDNMSRVPSKTKGGKVQKRTCKKKDQERANCDAAKLGTVEQFLAGIKVSLSFLFWDISVLGL